MGEEPGHGGAGWPCVLNLPVSTPYVLELVESHRDELTCNFSLPCCHPVHEETGYRACWGAYIQLPRKPGSVLLSRKTK